MAGAISVAVVSLLQLQGLFELDFTGSWIGNAMESVGELISGMSEAEAELRKITDVPVSWAKYGAEAFEDYKKVMEQTLTREIELMRELNEQRQHGNNLMLDTVAHEERIFQIKNPSLDPSTKGTDEWAKREREIEASKLKEGEAARMKTLWEATNNDAEARKEAARLQQDAQEARERAKGLKQRESYARDDANFELSIEAEKQKLTDMSRGGGPGAGMPRAVLDAIERQKKKIADMEADMERRRKRMEALPKPQGEFVTRTDEDGKEVTQWEGETVKSAEAEAEEKEDAAREAATRAAKAKRDREAAEQSTAQSREEDEAKAEQAEKRIQEAVFERTSEDDKKSKTKKEGNVPTPETPPAPQGARDVDGVNEAADWLDKSIKGTSNVNARHDLAEMKRRLLDGEGDTAAEVAVIQALITEIKEGKGNAATALQQAMQEMVGLSQQTAAAVSKVVEVVKGQHEEIKRVVRDVEEIRNKLRD